MIVENTYETQRSTRATSSRRHVLDIDKDDGRVHVWLCSKVPYKHARVAGLRRRACRTRPILFHHTLHRRRLRRQGQLAQHALCYFLAKASGPPRAHGLRLRRGVGRRQPAAQHDHAAEDRREARRHHRRPHGRVHRRLRRLRRLQARRHDRRRQPGGGALPVAQRAASTPRFVYTNNIPGGFMRAPGEPQGVFALESHLDEIARQLGMDPARLPPQEPDRRGRRDGVRRAPRARPRHRDAAGGRRRRGLRAAQGARTSAAASRSATAAPAAARARRTSR